MTNRIVKRIGAAAACTAFALMVGAGFGAGIPYAVSKLGFQTNAALNFTYKQANLTKLKTELKNRMPLVEQAKTECMKKAKTHQDSVNCKTTSKADITGLEYDIQTAQSELKQAGAELRLDKQNAFYNAIQTACVVFFATLFSMVKFKPAPQHNIAARQPEVRGVP
jgi:hypothetical protein